MAELIWWLIIYQMIQTIKLCNFLLHYAYIPLQENKVILLCLLPPY